MHVQPTTRVGLEHHLDLHDLRAARIGRLGRGELGERLPNGVLPGQAHQQHVQQRVPLSVLFVPVSAAGSGPPGTAADTSVGPPAPASTRADSSPEIATRLAVVGPYAAAVVPDRLVRAAFHEHHDRRRVRPHPLTDAAQLRPAQRLLPVVGKKPAADATDHRPHDQAD